MHKIRIIVICSALVVALGGAGFAHDSDVLGRDVVTSGTKTTLSGTLVSEDEVEWSVETVEGTYALHLGPPAFRDSVGLELRTGAVVTVDGYVHGKDVSPVSITLGSQTFHFRDESGRPLWAGTEASRRMGWNRSTNGAGGRMRYSPGNGEGFGQRRSPDPGPSFGSEGTKGRGGGSSNCGNC
jgi:hypothetical protein